MNADVIAISRELNASMNAPVVPDVGLHPGVPYPTYAGWDACNNGRLKMLARSPAHLLYCIKHPENRETDALILGGAIHTAILEPEQFDGLYQCGPIGRWNENPARARLDEIKSFFPNARILKPDAFDQCIAIRDAVWGHPAARLLLADHGGGTEESGVWNDPDSGQLCKLRADKLAPYFETIVDVKSTSNASPDGFKNAVFNFGYDDQAAMYLAGMGVLSPDVFRYFTFIAAEKEPPYAVGVYRLTDRSLMDAMTRVRRLVARYRACIDSGNYPGYGNEAMDLGAPDRELGRSA